MNYQSIWCRGSRPKFAKYWGTLHIHEHTRSFLSKFAQSWANLIHFDANPIRLELTRSDKGLNRPWGMPAHLRECSLTFEHACSNIHDFRSFLSKPLHSLCHELSNDMLDCLLIFIFSILSKKIIRRHLLGNNRSCACKKSTTTKDFCSIKFF